MVQYIGVSDIQRLVESIGTSTFIERLATEIEADYRRWHEFEK
jgi:ornithine cyclodeaminase